MQKKQYLCSRFTAGSSKRTGETQQTDVMNEFLEKEEAKFYLDLGFYLGFTGNITFKNAEDIREAVKYAPLDRILTETDSPYLAPIPKRGRRNEPSFISFIANKLAELKNVSVEEIAEKTTENAFRLFKKIKR